MYRYKRVNQVTIFFLFLHTNMLCSSSYNASLRENYNKMSQHVLSVVFGQLMVANKKMLKSSDIPLVDTGSIAFIYVF